MISTTTPFGPDFYKDLINGMFKAFDDGQRQALRMVWDIVITLLKQHWLSISAFLIGLLLVGVLVFLMSGRWGVLASIAYHYLYLTGIFLLGFIFGPEVFANEFIDLILLVLYFVCFSIVGMGLKKTNLR